MEAEYGQFFLSSYQGAVLMGGPDPELRQDVELVDKLLRGAEGFSLAVQMVRRCKEELHSQPVKPIMKEELSKPFTQEEGRDPAVQNLCRNATREDFELGSYVMSRKAGLSTTASIGGSFLQKLKPGMVVQVLEVVLVDVRVRARLADPAGWISLYNTENGYRWAKKQEPSDAAQVQSRPSPPKEKTAEPGQARSAPQDPPTLAPCPAEDPLMKRIEVADMQLTAKLDKFFRDDHLWPQVSDELAKGSKTPSPKHGVADSTQSAFRVLVPKPYPGVQYRKSKSMDDKYPRYAKHGCTVVGQVEDEGEWLRITGKPGVFLPMRIGNVQILEPISPMEGLANGTCLQAGEGWQGSRFWRLCSRQQAEAELLGPSEVGTENPPEAPVDFSGTAGACSDVKRVPMPLDYRSGIGPNLLKAARMKQEAGAASAFCSGLM